MNINLTLIAQAVAFGIFIWFCAKFVWPPLLRAIEARQKQIADGLAAAERGKQDLELASKRAEDVVREVALPTGLVDNKVCAIDSTWSALRLVIRLGNRR